MEINSPAKETFSEAVTALEKKYDITITFAEELGLNDKNSDAGRFALYESCLEEFFSRISPELHKAITAHFRAKGQAVTFHYTIFKDPTDPLVNYSNAKMEFLSTGAPEPIAIAVAYGHMVYEALKDIYGFEEFQNTWMTLYPDETYFVKPSEYRDDVSKIFSFIIEDGSSRLNRSEWSLKESKMNKALMLNNLISSAFKIPSTCRIYTLESASSTRAKDAYDRAFTGDSYAGIGIIGFEDERPISAQSPIMRYEFADYLIKMLDNAFEKKNKKRLTMKNDFGRFMLLDLATGEYNYAGWDNSCPIQFKTFYDFCHDHRNNDKDPIGVPVSVHYGLMLPSNAEQTRFNPYDEITREEAAEIFHRAAIFLDLPGAKRTNDSMGYVLRKNIMTSNALEDFLPDDPISYEDTIIALVKIYDKTHSKEWAAIRDTYIEKLSKIIKESETFEETFADKNEHDKWPNAVAAFVDALAYTEHDYIGAQLKSLKNIRNEENFHITMKSFRDQLHEYNSEKQEERSDW